MLQIEDLVRFEILRFGETLAPAASGRRWRSIGKITEDPGMQSLAKSFNDPAQRQAQSASSFPVATGKERVHGTVFMTLLGVVV